MITEKQKIVVIGEDKKVLNFLSMIYDITEVKSYTQGKDEALAMHKKGLKKTPIADFFIIDGNLNTNYFNLPNGDTISDTKIHEITRIYCLLRDVFYNPPKCIGFGLGALLLAKLNKAELLYNISNHNNTTHLASFLMPDGQSLEYDVPSNHSHLVVPGQRPFFDILAFSTYNNSQSYTEADGNVFKATRDFIEIEAIKFRPTNSYCFMYDIPDAENKALIDLTLQLLKR